MKTFVKHTAFIADELCGEDSLLYTNYVGSWLLGTDVIKTTSFPNFKNEKYLQTIKQMNVPFSAIFNVSLGESQLADYLKATEKRCELEKKTRNKFLDADTKASLKEEMKASCDSVRASLRTIVDNATRGNYKLLSADVVSDEAVRMAFMDTTCASTITFYGSKETWDKVQKPEDDAYLKNATYIFDENHADDPDGPDDPKPSLLGDANLDGKVTIADGTAILQSIANQDKYALNDEAKLNADCCNPGDGVTAADALTIKKLDAGVIKTLPELTE